MNEDYLEDSDIGTGLAYQFSRVIYSHNDVANSKAHSCWLLTWCNFMYKLV